MGALWCSSVKKDLNEKHTQSKSGNIDRDKACTLTITFEDMKQFDFVNKRTAEYHTLHIIMPPRIQQQQLDRLMYINNKSIKAVIYEIPKHFDFELMADEEKHPLNDVICMPCKNVTLALSRNHDVKFDTLLLLLSISDKSKSRHLSITGLEGFTPNSFQIDDWRISYIFQLFPKLKTLNNTNCDRIKPFYTQHNKYVHQYVYFGEEGCDTLPHDDIGEILRREYKSGVSIHDYLSQILSVKKEKLLSESYPMFTVNVDDDELRHILHLFARYITLPRVFLLLCFFNMNEPNLDHLQENLDHYVKLNTEHVFEAQLPHIKIGNTEDDGADALLTTKSYIHFMVNIHSFHAIKSALFDNCHKRAQLLRHKMVLKILHEFGHYKHYGFIEGPKNKKSYSMYGQEAVHQFSDLFCGGELYQHINENEDEKTVTIYDDDNCENRITAMFRRGMNKRPDSIDIDYIESKSEIINSKSPDEIYCVSLHDLLPIFDEIERGSVEDRNLFFIAKAQRNPYRHIHKTQSRDSRSLSSSDSRPTAAGGHHCKEVTTMYFESRLVD